MPYMPYKPSKKQQPWSRDVFESLRHQSKTPHEIRLEQRLSEMSRELNNLGEELDEERIKRHNIETKLSGEIVKLKVDISDLKKELVATKLEKDKLEEIISLMRNL